jgi:hypothetical protein
MTQAATRHEQVQEAGISPSHISRSENAMFCLCQSALTEAKRQSEIEQRLSRCFHNWVCKDYLVLSEEGLQAMGTRTIPPTRASWEYQRCCLLNR